MVDIINRTLSEQISFPILHSNARHISQNDALNIYNNNRRHWIGRCPGDPPRQFNISDSSYNLQRKLIYGELSRFYRTPVDTSILMKIKPTQQQRNITNKEPLKVTTVTSNSFLSNVDETNSRLFNTFSKHFTIKPEPLRPINNFLNNSTNTSSSSWQKYWKSTQIQRRRKEIHNKFETPFFRPKHDKSNLTKTHFVTVRDSSFYTNTTISRTSSIIPNHFTPIVIDKQSSFIEEEENFLPPIISSTSLMNSSKSFEDKSQSTIQSDSTIDNEINTLTAKIYKLPLPSNQLKTNKSILKNRSKFELLENKPTIPLKFIEKKQTTISTTPLPNNTSVPRRKTPTVSSNKSRRTMTKKQQESLSKIITTTPRSKYEHNKWDEPYIGIRHDPPTPSSSPTLFPLFQDHDDNEISYTVNTIN